MTYHFSSSGDHTFTDKDGDTFRIDMCSGLQPMIKATTWTLIEGNDIPLLVELLTTGKITPPVPEEPTEVGSTYTYNGVQYVRCAAHRFNWIVLSGEMPGWSYTWAEIHEAGTADE